MADWWGNMTGAQAVQMGQNIFNLAQQQAMQQRELQQQQEQQKVENFFARMQLNIQKEKLGLEAQKLQFDKDRLAEEDKRRKAESEFEKQKWQEGLGFKKEELGFKKTKLAAGSKPKQEQPDLSQFPKALEEATKRYEESGNWGEVQAVQKAFKIPVDKVPGKAKEVKEAINVWNQVEESGLPLKVDRKFGPGGEEQSLPQEIIKKYGAESIEALGKLSKGMMGGILGADKYRQYSISKLYEMYFKSKRLLNEGHNKEAIAGGMKQGKIPEDLINDILEVL